MKIKYHFMASPDKICKWINLVENQLCQCLHVHGSHHCSYSYNMAKSTYFHLLTLRVCQEKCMSDGIMVVGRWLVSLICMLIPTINWIRLIGSRTTTLVKTITSCNSQKIYKTIKLMGKLAFHNLVNTIRNVYVESNMISIDSQPKFSGISWDIILVYVFSHKKWVKTPHRSLYGLVSW